MQRCFHNIGLVIDAKIAPCFKNPFCIIILQAVRRSLFHKALLFYLFGFYSCQREIQLPAENSSFDPVPVVKPLNPVINEISGIADSKMNSGFLWGHEDSGNPAKLYLIKHDGSVLKSIHLDGIINRDWEEMALFNNEIFIGDIGDNGSIYPDYKFYKFAEPSSTVDTVRTIQAISFTYADGSHDAEAFFVDPLTKHIYIITKRDNPSKIYRLSFPFATNSTATLIGSLTYSGVTGAAISEDGKEIILKTYTALYYYKRQANENIEAAFQKNHTSLPYSAEPQGEAICFANDRSGFFTLSEKGFSSVVNVYFYKRR